MFECVWTTGWDRGKELFFLDMMSSPSSPSELICFERLWLREGPRGPYSTLFSRYLWDGGYLLVRHQHHYRLLQPLVCWNQVSEDPCPWGQWVGFGLAPLGWHLPLPLPRYELGPALYLGWSASLLSILGGICLFSTCCCASKEEPATR